MMKKLSSFLVAVSIFINLFAATNVFAASRGNDTVRGQSAAELVSALGIMDINNGDEMDMQTVVKRGQFALYAAKFMGYQLSAAPSGSRGSFDDVDISTEQGAAVQMLADLNIIPTDSREYNPNSDISYTDAVMIILNCLGYKKDAETRGGYPTGYLQSAANEGISDGAKNMGDSALEKSEVALMLYNALFVYPMIDNGYEYKKDTETVLERKYKVTEISGIVTGYGITSMSNAEVPDGSVSIDGVVYRCSASNIKDYIGHNVRAYYSESNLGEITIIAFVELKNKNTSATFEVDDIDSVSGTSIRYRADETNSSKLQRVASNACVIYNDRYYGTGIDLAALIDTVADGDVTCIANDGTSTANVIIVNSYKHLLLERVDKRGYRLYSKNGNSSLKSETDKLYIPDILTVDPNQIYVSVYIGDREVGFNDIQAGDAVTMKQSYDGNYVELSISRNVVTGSIEAIDEETMTIDSKEYDISPFIDREYSPGVSGSFAITTNGKILGIVEVSASANNYAYVLNAYSNNNTRRAYLKVFTSKGEVLYEKCASSFSINGSRVSNQEVPELLHEGDLITYELNSEGEFRSANRPYDASSNYISVDSEGNLSMYVNDTDFVKDWNKSSVRHTDGIMGMTFITEDTTIFAMPRFDDNNESEYRILKASDLENRTYSDVTAYDIDRQGRAGALVIVEDVSDSVSMSSPLFFISETGRVSNDGDIMLQVKGFEAGEEKTIYFDEESKSVTYEDGWMNYSGNEDFDTGYENLHKGDAIQYIIGNSGRVTAYRLVYNNQKTAFDKSGKYIENNSANYFEDWSGTGAVTKLDFSDNLYIAYGDVQMSYMDYMIVLGLPQKDRLDYASSQNPVSIMDYYRPVNLLKNAYVYVYDMTGPTHKLILGDGADIQRGDVCFVRSRKMGELNEIMVYRQ